MIDDDDNDDDGAASIVVDCCSFSSRRRRVPATSLSCNLIFTTPLFSAANKAFPRFFSFLLYDDDDL